MKSLPVKFPLLPGMPAAVRIVPAAAALALLLITCLLPADVVFAEVSLPSVFSDNMVLQRGQPITVWGKANAGETVSVAIDTLKAVTVAGVNGGWSLKLGPMEAGGPYDLVAAGLDTVTVTNVMIGDVWVCSGQSNMQWSLDRVRDAEEDIANADFPDIRLFSAPRLSSESPLYDFPDPKPSWLPCGPDTVKSFSAVAFFFGRELHEKLDVPIGLIHSSWGGSVAEAWTSMQTLLSHPELRPIVADLDSLKRVYPQEKQRYNEEAAARQQAVRDSLAVVPPMPLPPRGPGERDYPSGLFNGMLSPVIPFGIKGVIWYQGESNSVRAHQYRTLFPAMIRDWRKAWGQGDFPFLYVQIAGWETETIPVKGTWGSWPELREAQLMALSVPNTAMTVAIDIGEADNIHPNNKWEVGHRLALNAMAVAYGRPIVHMGPIYTANYREGQTIRLRFRHVADGLMAGNMEPLKGFTIAGRDRVFHPARAEISGSEVVVGSSEVPFPVAVRYAWDDNPDCNLYNTVGLPATPFRTDDWPGETDGRLVPNDFTP